MSNVYVTDVVNAIVKIMNGPITPLLPNGVWPYIATHFNVSLGGSDTFIDPLNFQQLVFSESGIECIQIGPQWLNMWAGCYGSAMITTLSGLAGAKINTSVAPVVAYSCIASPSLTITLQATANLSVNTSFNIQFGSGIPLTGCLQGSGGPSVSTGITVDLVFVIPVTLTQTQVTFQFNQLTFTVTNPQNITAIEELENDIQIAADVLTLDIMAIPGVWGSTLGSVMDSLNTELYSAITSGLSYIPSDAITSVVNLGTLTLPISGTGWPCCLPEFTMCSGTCCATGQQCYGGLCCTPTCPSGTCGGSDLCGGTCACAESPPQACVAEQCELIVSYDVYGFFLDDPSAPDNNQSFTVIAPQGSTPINSGGMYLGTFAAFPQNVPSLSLIPITVWQVTLLGTSLYGTYISQGTTAPTLQAGSIVGTTPLYTFYTFANPVAGSVAVPVSGWAPGLAYTNQTIFNLNPGAYWVMSNIGFYMHVIQSTIQEFNVYTISNGGFSYVTQSSLPPAEASVLSYKIFASVIPLSGLQPFYVYQTLPAAGYGTGTVISTSPSITGGTLQSTFYAGLDANWGGLLANGLYACTQGQQYQIISRNSPCTSSYPQTFQFYPVGVNIQ